MTSKPTHEEVETHFRSLLAEAELPPPDEVGYEPESVLFYWHEPKLVVAVDFDEEVSDAAVDASRPARAL